MVHDVGRKRLWVTLLGALCVFAVPGGAVAQEDCFCLIHPTTGGILRGCTAWRAPHEHYSRAECTDPDTGASSEQLVTDEWQRIPDGADRCTPCRRLRSSREGDFLPRGDDERLAPASGPTLTDQP